jgi:hypothetical protein
MSGTTIAIIMAVVVAVAVSTAFFWIQNTETETHVTILEPGLTINDPIVEPPPVEPNPVMEPEPAVAEPEEERGNGLRDSRWADAGFNPVEARRARGLPGTHREAERGGWPGEPGRWAGNGRGGQDPEREGGRGRGRGRAWGRAWGRGRGRDRGRGRGRGRGV